MRLRSDPATATQSAIQVDVVGSVVTLRGIVSSSEQKNAAGQIAETTQGVEQVENDLKDGSRSWQSLQDPDCLTRHGLDNLAGLNAQGNANAKNPARYPSAEVR